MQTSPSLLDDPINHTRPKMSTSFDTTTTNNNNNNYTPTSETNDNIYRNLSNEELDKMIAGGLKQNIINVRKDRGSSDSTSTGRGSGDVTSTSRGSGDSSRSSYSSHSTGQVSLLSIAEGKMQMNGRIQTFFF